MYLPATNDMNIRVRGTLLKRRPEALTFPFKSGLAAGQERSGSKSQISGEWGSKNQVESERSGSGRSSKREQSGEGDSRKWSCAMSKKFCRSAPLRSAHMLWLKGKIDIDTSVPSVNARTTRPLSLTAVKPRNEAGRSKFKLQQFLQFVLSLSLHRSFRTHCRTMSSPRTPWQLLKCD